MHLLQTLPLTHRLALTILSLAEVIVLFSLLRHYKGQELTNPNFSTRSARDKKFNPSKIVALAAFAFLVIILPILLYVTFTPTTFTPSAHESTLNDTFDTNPNSDKFLGLTWLEFRDPEHALYLKHSKCMRPFAATSFDNQPGWAFRCESGQTQLELYFVTFSFSEARARFPAGAGLSFEPFSNGSLRGWKAASAQKSVYYFLERNNNSNILLIGHLGKSNTPAIYDAEVIEHIAQSVRSLN